MARVTLDNFADIVQDTVGMLSEVQRALSKDRKEFKNELNAVSAAIRHLTGIVNAQKRRKARKYTAQSIKDK